MFSSRRHPWGFRCSVADLFILLATAIAAHVFRGHPGGVTWMLLLVVGHFFLFCNVFRVHRNRELLWAGVFVCNVLAWRYSGSDTWGGITLIQLPVTLAVLISEIRSAQYHGIFADKLNPKLDVYLQART